MGQILNDRDLANFAQCKRGINLLCFSTARSVMFDRAECLIHGSMSEWSREWWLVSVCLCHTHSQ